MVPDFMHAVESNLGMRYEIFDQWLNKQKQIATIHVLGFPITGELVKRMLFALDQCDINSLFLCWAFIDQSKRYVLKKYKMYKRRREERKKWCACACAYIF